MKTSLLLLVFLLVTTQFPAQENDIAGSKDHDLLMRMPGYDIRKYWDYEFDSHDFQIKKDQKESVEGRKIIIRYEHKKANNRNIKKPSYLQILRNYSNAITKAGGKILFEHRHADFGHYFLKTAKGKEVWVEVKCAPDLGRRYLITIIERESMRQDIVVKVDLIKEKISIEGKIAIYGIYFDTGKSVIKKESEASLNEIATFLNENPEINCWVVGQTDSDGSFEVNSKLSLNRALAVKTYLEEKNSIPGNRLFAEGVGSLAPVSSNSTEQGKKLNRRVELVKK